MNNKRIKIEIEGMTCPNCERHAGDELKKLGAKDIKVSHKEKSAIFTIEDSINEEVMKRAIKTAGYEPGKVFSKAVESSQRDDPIRKAGPKGFLGRLLK